MLNNFAGCADTETVNATSSSTAFTLGYNSNDVLVTVSADVIAFFVFSNTANPTATIATATHHCGKGTTTFSKPSNHKYGAVILASGTANVYLTPGNGL
jgi:hypothetical protein